MMEKEEILRKANEITQPHGLRAEFLAEDIFSVGVGGDNRTYTPVLNLVGLYPSNDLLKKLSTELCNNLPINRITIQI